jgi:probable rRNA maturation factor
MTLHLEWIDEREGGAGAREEAWMALLEQLLRHAGEAENVEDGVVTLTLTDDEGIRELNREYRGLDKPTDVLSFPLRETAGEEPPVVYSDEYEVIEEEAGDEPSSPDDSRDPFAELLGDIVISVPRAAAQAEEYGHSFERELGFLFVHGFLHLLGYDHDGEEQERVMFGKQEAILAKAGLTR